MTILAALAILFGVIGGVANFHQAWRVFRRKSSKDISIITYSLIFSGCIVWILYGFEIGDFPITLANSLGAIATGLVISGWYLYGPARWS
jgi:MtN3 and saliva related transmembrane protein